MHGSFVHLHCHSHYSLLDSTATIDQLVSRAAQLGMTALALTDQGNLHGALEFYSACKDAMIKPIIGYEALVSPDRRSSTAVRSYEKSCNTLTLLARDKTGFDSLLKLSTKAFLEGNAGLSVIDYEMLEACNEGLICLSGGLTGELSRSLAGVAQQQTGGHAEARFIATWFQRVFGARFFIEIQDAGVPLQRQVTELALDLARELGIPTAATCDCHYLTREDAEAHDILLRLKSGRPAFDPGCTRMGSDESYLKSPQEMHTAFEGFDRAVIADAVNRTQTIADSVSLELHLGDRYFPRKRRFPKFEIPLGLTSSEELRRLCLEGLRERYAAVSKRWADGKTPSEGGSGVLHGDVIERLDHEIDVIDTLGLASYFRIVWDLLREGRSRSIPAAARGWSVGSLVVYGLGCSQVCPLEYDLLFEPFLDVSHSEAPQIDIDCCKERRGELIDYVKQKYGNANVARIGTFGTRHAKAAIRDVGRVIGTTLPRVEEIVELVPNELGISLSEAALPGTPLANACDANAEVAELVDLAKRIEGLVRDVGIHAAAVVIADRPLVDYVPLCRVGGKEEVVTQWGMRDVERADLMKIGVLGVRHLTVMSKALDSIEATSGVRPDPLSFPLDDDATFAMLCRGDTEGVFQLESDGTRDILTRMKPDHFLDLVAINALYRPGPLTEGMLDEYIDVKNGRRKAAYLHPVMGEVLGETYGVIAYREQILRLLNRLGGIKLGDAHLAMKGLRHSNPTVRAWLRTKFMQGAEDRGLEGQQATEVLAVLERYASHSFNKSHAAAYALPTWQTAYLRTHHPQPYLAAARA